MSGWRKALRIALWVLGGLVALVLVLAAFLAISIALDGRGSAERLAEVTNVTIPGADGPDVPAFVATPSGAGPHPVVIMVHEFWGLNPDIVSKAELLAQEGYVVVAPSVFRTGTTGYLPRAIYQTITTPAEEVNEDLDAVVAWVREQPGSDATRIGITGFCFGGRTSLLYSLHNPSLQATSVFYGDPVTDPERLGTLERPRPGHLRRRRHIDPARERARLRARASAGRHRVDRDDLPRAAPRLREERRGNRLGSRPRSRVGADGRVFRRHAQVR